MNKNSGFARRRRALKTALARSKTSPRRASLGLALVAATAVVAAPGAAQAAVVPVVSSDTLTVTGDGAADQIALRVIDPATLQVDTGGSILNFNRSTFHKVAIRSGAGGDTVRIEDALTESVTIETGAGADTVLGGPGDELISSGDDGDQVASGAGDDIVFLGAGNDTAFQGDGQDSVDGQDGEDVLLAVGSSDSEEFTVQGFDGTARISRDTGPATTDSVAVEALDVNAAGGQDLIDVGDLEASDVTKLDADLGFNDGTRDDVSVQGTDGSDHIDAAPSGGSVRVEGLRARVTIHGASAATDRLQVLGRGDTDIIDAVGDVSARIGLTLDGGADPDLLYGSSGAETIRGGDGRDSVVGLGGNDTVDLGEGDDVFSRGPQDGVDHVAAGTGDDLLTANGGSADENIQVLGLLANTRVLYGFSGSAETTGFETVSVAPFGGTDSVTVGDLSTTSTKTVNVPSSTPDLRVDIVTVTGTQGAETIKLGTDGTTQTVSGLPCTVNVLAPERGEKIAIDGRDGADTIDATGLERDTVQPSLTGGAGSDVIIGSSSDDRIAGGTGVDVALMGGGLDTFAWAPGDGNDVVEGQAGTDFLQMNGSGGNERIDVNPVGGRTRVTRDIENVNVDLGGLERLDLLPGPGGDVVHVADLSGTATNRVDVNLMTARGQIAGDNALDRVFVDGSNGVDTINVNGAGPDVRVSGLANITTVRGTDPELDRLHIDTKLGADSLSVTGTTHSLIGFTSS